jgi:hypothetical protein
MTSAAMPRRKTRPTKKASDLRTFVLLEIERDQRTRRCAPAEFAIVILTFFRETIIPQKGLREDEMNIKIN